MKFLYNIDGSQNNVRLVPVLNGATALLKGAALVVGPTAGTDSGSAIIAGAALADVVGVLEEALAASVGTLVAGTRTKRCKVGINPFGVYLAEYSLEDADNVAPTSASSSTTVNLTSLTNNTGGFLYSTTSTATTSAAGQLRYVVSGTTNVNVTKTAFSPVVNTTEYLMKILPPWITQLVVITSDATKLASTAAVGTGAARVITNFMQYDGQPLVELDPVLHDGLDGLDSKHPHFYAAIMFMNHALNIGD